jgi:hypothetical protein
VLKFIVLCSIDLTNPYERRQHDLRDRYAFTCACIKCRKGPTLQEDQFLVPLSEISSQHLAEIIANANRYLAAVESHIPANATSETVVKAIEEYATKLIEKCHFEAPVEAVAQLRSGLELMASTNLFPIHRQPFATLRYELFVSYMANGNYIDGLFQGLKTYFDVDPVLYPQTHHPTRVEHIWTLGKLALFLAMDGDQPGVDPMMVVRKAQSMNMDVPYLMYGLMGEASDIVGKSYGVDFSFTKKIKNKFYEVTVDMSRNEAIDLRAVQRSFLKSLPFWRAMAVKHTKGTVSPSTADTSAQEEGAF